VASFACEQFSVSALTDLTLEKIERRVRQLRDLCHFDV